MSAFAWPDKGETMVKKTKARTAFIHLRVPPNEVTALRQLAEALDLSLSELVRILIARGLEGLIAPEKATDADDG
ncbi:MAG: ribbon-helix-helix protein, CopG family [Chloroflexi bacterium]|nr:ribbon-helix-helix protein, CopG family [Chloroflexota bacterium]